MNLSKLNCLVYDYGLHTEIAVRLARDFGSVKYYVHWEDAFPKSKMRRVGEGLEGVERISDFWMELHKGNVDFVYCPDSLTAGILEHIRDTGVPVAGPGVAEKFEQDRVFGRFDVQKAAGLPTQKTIVLEGITKLREFLSKSKDEWIIKLNTSRGDRETFKHIDYEQTEPILDKLGYDLGPWKEQEEFVLEEVIPGIEPGFDGIVFKGKFLSPCMYGYEVKGGGFIGRVCKYDELPRPLKLVNDKLSPYFKESDTRSFFSTEIKLEGKNPFLIDPTIRHPGPIGYSIQTELIENFSQVVYGMGVGEEVSPVMKYKYAGGVSFNSDEARDNWMRIKFPENLRRWIKLRMAAKVDGNYYAAPGFDNICTVIALSNFLNEIPGMIEERADTIQAQSIEKDLSGLTSINEQIAEGKKHGISF